MIRQTLASTKAATFAILLPDPRLKGMPRPYGTGFFVSSSGVFVTAAHVVTEDGSASGRPRDDLSDCRLEKEARFIPGQLMPHRPMCIGATLECVIPEKDIAILRIDWESNSNRGFNHSDGFPSITVSTRLLEEGEQVYAFGYPLPDVVVAEQAVELPGAIVGGPGSTVSLITHRPRVTSAIIASTLETSGPVMRHPAPIEYVLDKALNFGNSGGPIISVATGHVHAVCSRFQPMPMPQPHTGGKDGPLNIFVPSLYSTVSNIADSGVEVELAKRGVALAAD